MKKINFWNYGNTGILGMAISRFSWNGTFEFVANLPFSVSEFSRHCSIEYGIFIDSLPTKPFHFQLSPPLTILWAIEISQISALIPSRVEIQRSMPVEYPENLLFKTSSPIQYWRCEMPILAKKTTVSRFARRKLWIQYTLERFFRFIAS